MIQWLRWNSSQQHCSELAQVWNASNWCSLSISTLFIPNIVIVFIKINQQHNPTPTNSFIELLASWARKSSIIMIIHSFLR
jgi:hypothetical protein